VLEIYPFPLRWLILWITLWANAEHLDNQHGTYKWTDCLICNKFLCLLEVCSKIHKFLRLLVVRFSTSCGFLWLDFQLLAFWMFLRVNCKNTTFLLLATVCVFLRCKKFVRHFLHMYYFGLYCISLKNALLSPLPTQHNVENQVKLQALVFNIVWGGGGEVRQVKLYLHLACAKKRLKCKFVPRLLSMIVACTDKNLN